MMSYRPAEEKKEKIKDLSKKSNARMKEQYYSYKYESSPIWIASRPPTSYIGRNIIDLVLIPYYQHKNTQNSYLYIFV